MTFEDLKVFKAATELIAAISVAANIAEGQGRWTRGEWRQLLSQSRGSLFEIEAEVTVARRLRYIHSARHNELRRTCKDVGAPLAGLLRYVQRQEALAKKRTGNR